MRIAVFGDTRTGHDVHRVLAGVARKFEPSLVINLGDIVIRNTAMHEWYLLFELEKELLASAPLALAPGNHETWWDIDLAETMLNRLFSLDGKGGTGHYSFDFGPVHVAVLDLYWGKSLLDEGMEWLDADLAAVAPATHTIIALHEPPYSFGAHRPRPAVKALREACIRHDVSAVLAGHAHLYEHFLADGTHYLTIGGSGAALTEPLQNVFPAQEKYLVKTEKAHHYLELTASKARLDFRVVGPKGEVVEEFTVLH